MLALLKAELANIGLQMHGSKTKIMTSFNETSIDFIEDEIYIQTFVDFINGELMSGHSSSSTFHDFQEFIISNYKKPGIQNFKNSKWTDKVSIISIF